MAAVTPREHHLCALGMAPAAWVQRADLDERPHHVVADLDELSRWLRAARPRSVYLWLPDGAFDLALGTTLVALSTATQIPLGVAYGPGAAPAATPAPLRAASVAVYCDFRAYGDADVALGYGAEEVDELLARVRRGVDALVYQGHGNGADFRLGRRAALCVQADAMAPARAVAGEACLPCQAGGTCRFAHRPLERFVGASELAARLVVLISCWSYSPSGGLLAPRFQLAHALMMRGGVEALVASFRVHYNTPGLAVAAGRLLEQGGTMGELALAMNGVHDPGSYLCLGDPCLAAVAPGQPLERRATLARDRPPPPELVEQRRRAAAALLHDAEQRLRETSTDVEASRLRRRAVEILVGRRGLEGADS